MKLYTLKIAPKSVLICNLIAENALGLGATLKKSLTDVYAKIKC